MHKISDTQTIQGVSIYFYIFVNTVTFFCNTFLLMMLNGSLPFDRSKHTLSELQKM